MSELYDTPARGRGYVDSVAFSSTHLLSHPSHSHRSSDTYSVVPDVSHLITHISQQVGQTISAQLRGDTKAGEDQLHRFRIQMQAIHSLMPHLTGVRFVMQTDVKELPIFRGDGLDKLSVHEWEELMDAYLRKRSMPLGEWYQEIVSRLMGKARDIVKITLHNHPSLKPDDNPKVITV